MSYNFTYNCSGLFCYEKIPENEMYAVVHLIHLYENPIFLAFTCMIAGASITSNALSLMYYGHSGPKGRGGLNNSCTMLLKALDILMCVFVTSATATLGLATMNQHAKEEALPEYDSYRDLVRVFHVMGLLYFGFCKIGSLATGFLICMLSTVEGLTFYAPSHEPDRKVLMISVSTSAVFALISWFFAYRYILAAMILYAAVVNISIIVKRSHLPSFSRADKRRTGTVLSLTLLFCIVDTTYLASDVALEVLARGTISSEFLFVLTVVKISGVPLNSALDPWVFILRSKKWSKMVDKWRKRRNRSTELEQNEPDLNSTFE